MVLAINRERLTKVPDRRSPGDRRHVRRRAIEASRSRGRCSRCCSWRTTPAASTRPRRRIAHCAQRYYGAAAYDFGEVPLADVAAAIRARGDLPRMSFSCMPSTSNSSPRSGFAPAAGRGSSCSAGRLAAAIGCFERALGLNANDSRARDLWENYGDSRGRLEGGG